MSQNNDNCGCCANPYLPGNQSVNAVCGTFPTPDNPDKGQCFPYREKRDCEAPVKPENPCNDTAAYAEPRPGHTPPFVIVATIFDENCEPIQDQHGAPIMAEYQTQ